MLSGIEESVKNNNSYNDDHHLSYGNSEKSGSSPDFSNKTDEIQPRRIKGMYPQNGSLDTSEKEDSVPEKDVIFSEKCSNGPRLNWPNFLAADEEIVPEKGPNGTPQYYNAFPEEFLRARFTSLWYKTISDEDNASLEVNFSETGSNQFSDDEDDDDDIKQSNKCRFESSINNTESIISDYRRKCQNDLDVDSELDAADNDDEIAAEEEEKEDTGLSEFSTNLQAELRMRGMEVTQEVNANELQTEEAYTNGVNEADNSNSGNICDEIDENSTTLLENGGYTSCHSDLISVMKNIKNLKFSLENVDSLCDRMSKNIPDEFREGNGNEIILPANDTESLEYDQLRSYQRPIAPVVKKVNERSGHSVTKFYSSANGSSLNSLSEVSDVNQNGYTDSATLNRSRNSNIGRDTLKFNDSIAKSHSEFYDRDKFSMKHSISDSFNKQIKRRDVQNPNISTGNHINGNSRQIFNHNGKILSRKVAERDEADKFNQDLDNVDYNRKIQRNGLSYRKGNTEVVPIEYVESMDNIDDNVNSKSMKRNTSRLVENLEEIHQNDSSNGKFSASVTDNPGTIRNSNASSFSGNHAKPNRDVSSKICRGFSMDEYPTRLAETLIDKQNLAPSRDDATSSNDLSSEHVKDNEIESFKEPSKRIAKKKESAKLISKSSNNLYDHTKENVLPSDDSCKVGSEEKLADKSKTVANGGGSVGMPSVEDGLSDTEYEDIRPVTKSLSGDGSREANSDENKSVNAGHLNVRRTDYKDKAESLSKSDENQENKNMSGKGKMNNLDSDCSGSMPLKRPESTEISKVIQKLIEMNAKEELQRAESCSSNIRNVSYQKNDTEISDESTIRNQNSDFNGMKEGVDCSRKYPFAGDCKADYIQSINSNVGSRMHPLEEVLLLKEMESEREPDDMDRMEILDVLEQYYTSSGLREECVENVGDYSEDVKDSGASCNEDLDNKTVKSRRSDEVDKLMNELEESNEVSSGVAMSASHKSKLADNQSEDESISCSAAVTNQELPNKAEGVVTENEGVLYKKIDIRKESDEQEIEKDVNGKVDDDIDGQQQDQMYGKEQQDSLFVPCYDTPDATELSDAVLIEGVLFRGRYLGSTQLISEGQPSKAMRMIQAQEAINRIKEQSSTAGRDTQSHPSSLVDLFVSVEKIMVLNTDMQEIMMDHALRTISYIADIGDVLVIMARRGPVESSPPKERGEGEGEDKGARGAGATAVQNKICCHVFESEEAQLIAQSISQAFQVAYMEFLKANGINDPDIMKEMNYQDVLSQQEIFGEELFLFSNRDMQKEVLIPKLKSEPLGVVIVESGWGSMVPTVVMASLQPGGPAARCGQLNIGDQIISINGISLVGLSLSTCQNYIRSARNEMLVRLMVVSCTPVVEVLVKRPDLKYQLGFSVQNGVICSLLRGGIAERGGVRVGHRIIEINNQSVVAVPHEKIVSMLASSVGEIHMKTMQTSIYRLLTGQDIPHYI